ncbi:uncharacterized protein LOC119071063 [Bradysia coprophila]|uniref:uncharacterized protein LOC119071063 n=1 Tax=Bradysia coprophila TaxID=38358 RepID=UPI00187D9ACF|nr:uncharacterized protein LOC119071063 [Bradysia coprophila]
MSDTSSPSTITSTDAVDVVSPDPPLAPNWNDNMEKTILSLQPYQLFPIAADTLEYATIASLLDPFEINAVEQIVNPMLWSRFTNTRKQMLLSKSDDCTLLPKLSSDHTKIFHQMHIASSFEPDARVAAYPYNDNLALLFHCTRSMANVNTILIQGLDERLGAGGLLGKGIYFASDPRKSVFYDGCGGTIFLFMVLLGDCLSVSQREAQLFVREPLKVSRQQRNYNDVNFDSIVGQPGVNGSCEYVVYNRFQCCPLYKISYKASSTGTAGIYSQSINSLPPFAWKSSKDGAIATPPSTISSDWPLYAKNIFIQMGVAPQIQQMDVDMSPQVKIEETAEAIDDKMTVLANLGFPNTERTLDVLKKNSYDLDATINALLEESAGTMLDESEILINNKLATLSNLGFINAELNAEILKKNSYDLNRCVCELLEQGASDGRADDADATNGAGPYQSQKSKFKECEICSESIDESSPLWKVLLCGHELCEQCYEQIETTRTTMSGIQHTFIKCPFCLKTSGTEIGTCPNGAMTTSIVATPCQGYEEYHSIRVQYTIECPSYQLNRTAFLPDNDEGNELLRLLRIAWDRRICFTIGTSATNGQENALVWNIHHKTAQNGGVMSHGYPDDTFINRCKSELNAFGIN